MLASWAVTVRDATADDWPAVWAFMRGIVAAGDTFSWAPTTSESEARAIWMRQRPGRTYVAVDATGAVVGSATSGPNQPAGGPADHVATASFMVDPSQSGHGVGRALAEHVIDQARRDGFRAMQFNAVVSTNTTALRLWTALGFETLATLPEGFRHPTQGRVGLHIMFRTL